MINLDFESSILGIERSYIRGTFLIGILENFPFDEYFSFTKSLKSFVVDKSGLYEKLLPVVFRFNFARFDNID